LDRGGERRNHPSLAPRAGRNAGEDIGAAGREGCERARRALHLSIPREARGEGKRTRDCSIFSGVASIATKLFLVPYLPLSSLAATPCLRKENRPSRAFLSGIELLSRDTHRGKKSSEGDEGERGRLVRVAASSEFSRPARPEMNFEDWKRRRNGARCIFPRRRGSARCDRMREKASRI